MMETSKSELEDSGRAQIDSEGGGDRVLRVDDIRKWYPLKRGFFETLVSRTPLNVKAVDGVSFDLKKGEIFALAGESGSGKTTLGKLVLRLVAPSSGSIFFQEGTLRSCLTNR